MMVHPTQKTQKTTRLLAKKLIHKSIYIVLELTGLIGLYFYSLLIPFYGIGNSTFKKTTNKNTHLPKDHCGPNSTNHPGIEKREGNNRMQRRPWKAWKPHHWDMTKMLTKVIILTIISLYYIEDLHKTLLNRKPYNLAHNTRFIGQRGNAFPIKPDTMIKNRKRIHNINRCDHRKNEKLKNTALGGVFHLLNLRFLPQAIKRTVTKIAEALIFLIKHIDPN